MSVYETEEGPEELADKPPRTYSEERAQRRAALLAKRRAQRSSDAPQGPPYAGSAFMWTGRMY